MCVAGSDCLGCDLDPLPACLLSTNLHVLMPVIAKIVNFVVEIRIYAI